MLTCVAAHTVNQHLVYHYLRDQPCQYVPFQHRRQKSSNISVEWCDHVFVYLTLILG